MPDPSRTTTHGPSEEPVAGREPVALADVARALQERLERLRAARHAQLRASGVQCLACEDTGFRPSGAFCSCPAGEEVARREREREQERIAQAWQDWSAALPERLGIPTRYRSFRIDRLGDAKPIRLVRRWLEQRRSDEGLVLVGPFGCGKTAVAAAVLVALVERAAREESAGTYPPDPSRLGHFVTLTGLLEALRPHPDGHPDQTTLRSFQRVRVLVLDDIGAERLTAWGADRLYEVLNARYNDQLPTIVTTNLDLSRIAARWNQQLGDESGDRLVNRLIECCAVVRWPDDAPNLRLQHA